MKLCILTATLLLSGAAAHAQQPPLSAFSYYAEPIPSPHLGAQIQPQWFPPPADIMVLRQRAEDTDRQLQDEWRERNAVQQRQSQENATGFFMFETPTQQGGLCTYNCVLDFDRGR